MKNLNKLFTAFALMILVGSANILAQSSTNANVTVSATVEAAIVLTPAAVALGTIQSGSNSVLRANANETGTTEANIGSGASAGSLGIVGTSGADVVVSWTAAQLNRTEDDDPIAFTPSVYNGSSAVSSGGNVTLTGGSISLDIGGTLTAPSNTGTYNTTLGTSSPIVFSVSYE